jgi:hypothetical protein
MSLSPETIAALALAWDDITQSPGVKECAHGHMGLWQVTYDGCTYAIGTEAEAEAAAAEYIKDTLWAFRPEFLCDYINGPMRPEWLSQIIGDRCEDSNSDVTDMVGDNIYELISDAIAADGIGHFLMTYDNEYDETMSPAGERLVIVRVD